MIAVNLAQPRPGVYHYDALDEIVVVTRGPHPLIVVTIKTGTAFQLTRARKARPWRYFDDLGRLQS